MHPKRFNYSGMRALELIFSFPEAGSRSRPVCYLEIFHIEKSVLQYYVSSAGTPFQILGGTLRIQYQLRGAEKFLHVCISRNVFVFFGLAQSIFWVGFHTNILTPN